ncbi:MAG: GNAT family N-acetyltransferase [Candidatus Omnitrophica bacterium]|nr:GNAT family N-acetyltransferase [Candidatus Omnitrophota bacterium]
MRKIKRKIKNMGMSVKRLHRTKLFHISRLKLGRFRQKIKVYIEKGNFVIKTVENSRELEDVLRLRFTVFYQEMLEKNALIQSDIDQFDFICDHLVVFDKEKEKYVGTYRLNLSSFSKKFYSSQEFDIDNILRLPDTKLELGRACVDKEYRTGIIIALLWRGLAEYVRLSGARYLFGCSSVKTTDIHDVSLLYLYLMQHHSAPDELAVVPHKNFRVPNLTEHIKNSKYTKEEISRAKSLLPPLLSFYLKAGAYVCGEPALDKAFKCVDFFTILDMKNLSETLEKKYSV